MGMEQGKVAIEPVNTNEFLDELPPGTRLLDGEYVCQDFLGADGFGITYLASDASEKVVVIKECFPGAFCRRQETRVQPRSTGHEVEVSSIVGLFKHEAENLARLSHPNLVRIRNVFEENKTAYIAMDFVNGRDLQEIIQDDTIGLTPDQIEGYLEKMLEALSLVHEHGMLHRDITPSNIIISQDDEPVLIDFGTAREEATKSSRILSVLRVVKEGYSPQEIYLSGSEQGPACDIYSLAASFYHLITNELPPSSQQRLAASASGQTDPYVPLAEQTRHFDDRFCAALDKAMSILPRDRFQSAKDWIDAMRPEPVVTAPVVQLRVKPQRPVIAAPMTLDEVETETASHQVANAQELEDFEKEIVSSADIIDDEEEQFEEVAYESSPGVMSKLLRGSAVIAIVAGAAILISDRYLGGTTAVTAMALAPQAPAAIAGDSRMTPFNWRAFSRSSARPLRISGSAPRKPGRTGYPRQFWLHRWLPQPPRPKSSAKISP